MDYPGVAAAGRKAQVSKGARPGAPGEFLVTGDKELQSLKRHKSTRIISPAAMMNLLKEAEKDREE
jgi:hypothetical protein